MEEAKAISVMQKRNLKRVRKKNEEEKNRGCNGKFSLNAALRQLPPSSVLVVPCEDDCL
jgi:hypothetical protein